MSFDYIVEQKWTKDLPGMIKAGLTENKRDLELSAISLVRRLRKEFPDVSKEIASVLSSYSSGAGVFRSAGIAPPADRDSNANLLQVEDKITGAQSPLFNSDIKRSVDRFIAERIRTEELLAAGVFPANKLLLTGAPGTGKTMLATWLAQELGMKLAVFDLATSISSLLGNTGMNIKRIFTYAKQESIILFLDEFDAIAKRRDDTTDVGELKRIVNVLLKEMEAWPSRSILIAATNHPEMLDSAIHRRFDTCITLPMPNGAQTENIIIRALGSYAKEISSSVIKAACNIQEEHNASDIVLFANNSIKHHLISGDSMNDSILLTLLEQTNRVSNSKSKGELLRKIKQSMGKRITVRKLASLSGLSSTTVQYHIKKGADK